MSGMPAPFPASVFDAVIREVAVPLAHWSIRYAWLFVCVVALLVVAVVLMTLAETGNAKPLPNTVTTEKAA